MDANQINQTFDLLSLVEQHTTLKRVGRHYCGPCPLCGGVDRFVIKQTPNGYRWICRKCGDGKYHTAIDYVMQHENLDFTSTLHQLDGTPPEDTRSCKKILPKNNSFILPDKVWMDQAFDFSMKASQDLLFNPVGQEGRDYLVGRGIRLGTWETWFLGISYIWDPKKQCERPAILLPYTALENGDELITAIKVRFIDSQPDGLRYIAHPGSVFTIYGLWDVHPPYETLIIVEGEINALSIWQMLPSGVTVVSIGSESVSHPELLMTLAKRYQKVIIWTDKPERARTLQGCIIKKAHLLQSPQRGETKWDANQMLQEDILAPFLSKITGVPCLGCLN